jgi:hypothetical protein
VINGGAKPTYQWFVNNDLIAGATNSTYTSNKYSIDHQDSASCTVTASDACAMSTHQWIYISVHNVGVKPVTAQDGLTVTPNPSKGSFEINGTVSGTADAAVALELTDLLGQVVYSSNVTAKNGMLHERIQLSKTIANGMYLLNVRSAEGSRVFHVVIEQ